MTALLWIGFMVSFIVTAEALMRVPTTRGAWAFIATTGGAMLAFAYLLGGA